jgi:hypothetical protein
MSQTIKLNQHARGCLLRVLEPAGLENLQQKVENHDPMDPISVSEQELGQLAQLVNSNVVASTAVDWENACYRITEKNRAYGTEGTTDV